MGSPGGRDPGSYFGPYSGAQIGLQGQNITLAVLRRSGTVSTVDQGYLLRAEGVSLGTLEEGK